MWLFATGLLVLLMGAAVSLLLSKTPHFASRIGAGTAIVGSALAVANALWVLWVGQTVKATVPWDIPFGSLSFRIDPLSAVFIFPIGFVVAVAALYGDRYMRGSYPPSVIGSSWFFFNLLASTMLLVVVAKNGLLFLVCWEGMSLASFFLVLTDHEQPSVRRAGWIYLAAMHMGTACLLVLFLLLGRSSGSLDFDRFTCEPGLAGILFVLAVVGFGTKAGIVPFHVWLPEAHPAAPSHVSAVMSGVMIKTGIYGILRTLTFLTEVPSWWGWMLVTLGAASGILGVIFALAQHDLKKLLAYHSVENIGIIVLGMGVGLLGIAYRVPVMAFCGFAGALLHVFNHALFKSLLFLGAGAVQHAGGTRDIDRLGGLFKRMPVTGTTFLIGACAISGLPPLNGFVSELMIYLGTLAGVVESGHAGGVEWALLCVLVIGSLAFIGGLAAACFTKAFGCVFLGEPRSDRCAHGSEVATPMVVSMIVLAAACFCVALAGPIWPYVYQSAVATIVPHDLGNIARVGTAQMHVPLLAVCAASWALPAFVGLAAAVRRRILSGRTVERQPTWGCGYVAPTPRMQYTASSFAAPLLSQFRLLLRPRVRIQPPKGLFPKESRFESETPDFFREFLFQPVFKAISWTASKLRRFECRRIQLNVLYVALTILILFIWKLG